MELKIILVALGLLLLIAGLFITFFKPKRDKALPTLKLADDPVPEATAVMDVIAVTSATDSPPPESSAAAGAVAESGSEVDVPPADAAEFAELSKPTEFSFEEETLSDLVVEPASDDSGNGLAAMMPKPEDLSVDTGETPALASVFNGQGDVEELELEEVEEAEDFSEDIASLEDESLEGTLDEDEIAAALSQDLPVEYIEDENIDLPIGEMIGEIPAESGDEFLFPGGRTEQESSALEELDIEEISATATEPAISPPPTSAADMLSDAIGKEMGEMFAEDEEKTGEELDQKLELLPGTELLEEEIELEDILGKSAEQLEAELGDELEIDLEQDIEEDVDLDIKPAAAPAPPPVKPTVAGIAKTPPSTAVPPGKAAEPPARPVREQPVQPSVATRPPTDSWEKQFAELEQVIEEEQERSDDKIEREITSEVESLLKEVLPTSKLKPPVSVSRPSSAAPTPTRPLAGAKQPPASTKPQPGAPAKQLSAMPSSQFLPGSKQPAKASPKPAAAGTGKQPAQPKPAPGKPAVPPPARAIPIRTKAEDLISEAEGMDDWFDDLVAEVDFEPAAPQPEPAAPAPTIAPVAASAASTDEHDRKVARAQRIARTIVTDIKNYNADLLAEGIKTKRIRAVLNSDIDKGKKLYRERVTADIDPSGKYFEDAVIQILAGGNAALMG